MKSVVELADELAARRARFVWPVLGACLVVYTGALTALSYGEFVTTKIVGNINIAYVIAVGIICATFLVALAYARWARRYFDPLAEELREALEREGSLEEPVGVGA
ncbi:DUF485 domain-containing protein [Rhodococcus opacus]|uniref:DUF485 domain-containing protein n=1 Tax=Rhodococcus opacus TaxID=37919 RepID=UPI0016049EB3|nr:DUF485 domain-containing protein [Rhodococcus opacus]QZS52575.1 DUF485 domain-containing protein [Rhodococcus opacus]